MPLRLFVLDGPGYLFRAYHALPYLSTSRGVPVNTVLGMSTMLWKLLEKDAGLPRGRLGPAGPTFETSSPPTRRRGRLRPMTSSDRSRSSCR